jgi:cyclic beta-1,2-glucan synthetase
MQRAGVESILGLRRQGLFLHLDPCIPITWPGFDVMVRHHSAQYKIAVKNPAGVSRGIVSAQIDGKILTERPVRFPLSDDGIVHHVEVSLG